MQTYEELQAEAALLSLFSEFILTESSTLVICTHRIPDVIPFSDLIST